jgi:hypothetical protein
MPELSTILVFSLAAVALIAVPGPKLIYITAPSLSSGRRAGLDSAVGVETGTLAERAGRELRATGETARKRVIETRDDLTPSGGHGRSARGGRGRVHDPA